jgi:hypothetical protein
MKILKIIIEKKLDSYNNYDLKKYYAKAVWQFYQAYNPSVAFLKLYEKLEVNKKEMNKRNRIYLNLLSTGKLTESDSEKMNRYIKKDMEIISHALDVLNKIEESSDSYVGDFEKADYIGILASEIMR